MLASGKARNCLLLHLVQTEFQHTYRDNLPKSLPSNLLCSGVFASLSAECKKLSSRVQFLPQCPQSSIKSCSLMDELSRRCGRKVFKIIIILCSILLSKVLAEIAFQQCILLEAPWYIDHWWRQVCYHNERWVEWELLYKTLSNLLSLSKPDWDPAMNVGAALWWRFCLCHCKDPHQWFGNWSIGPRFEGCRRCTARLPTW